MTTLICSGTLFSDWKASLYQYLLTDLTHHPKHTELSGLNLKICQDRWPQAEKPRWVPFSPSQTYTSDAKQLLLSGRKDKVSIWADTDTCLLLDFWKKANSHAKFLLFYSSPEHELGSYIDSHGFNESSTRAAMKAWLIRTRAMLAFFIYNRSRCLMINVESACSEQLPFVEAVNEHFKLSLACKNPITKDKSGKSVLVECLASSLLLGNETVSELYDEVRSAATVICEKDTVILDTQSRSSSMINTFLEEAAAYRKLAYSHKELEEDLLLTQLQISQIMEELEYYYKANRDQGELFATYLNSDPLLRTARLVRQSR